ncbi:MAG: mammalian cell entry protein [Mycobacterium sp.]
MGRTSIRLLVLLGALLGAAVVVLGACGGAAYWTHAELTAQQQTSATLPDLAKEEIPRIFGFDYQSIERSRVEAYELMTPSFRKQYEEDTANKIVPEARKHHVVSQASVVGVGMLDSQRDSGSVLVYLNQTFTNESKQPMYQGSRLRVDFVKVGNNWLINQMTPIF